MRQPILVCLAVALSLTACSRIADSRLNPLNWFGASAPAAIPVDADGNRLPLIPAGGSVEIDARILIERVETLRIDRTPGGAIVSATGIASSQGQFNAQLVPVRAEAGTLTLAFRVEIAPQQTAQGTAFSRQITAARAFTDAELLGVGRIVVQGRTNARAASR